MILTDLFEQLAKREFQNHETGNLFFRSYIYCYDPLKEYQIRNEIKELKERLIRPDIFQDTLSINIYDEFIEYLKTEKLADDTLFDLFVQQEKEESETESRENLKQTADSIEFLKQIDKKIRIHFQLPSRFKKVYVLVHGFGSIFPHLRASEFLNRFEGFISDGQYKIIVLYPGKYENNHFYLFNEINHESIYRTTLLNK